MNIGISHSSQPLTKNGLTFLTNFSPQYLSVYEEAIKYFNHIVKEIDKPHFEIRETCNGSSGYGLWYKSKNANTDFSIFWDIYELAKANRLTLLAYMVNRSS